MMMMMHLAERSWMLIQIPPKAGSGCCHQGHTTRSWILIRILLIPPKAGLGCRLQDYLAASSRPGTYRNLSPEPRERADQLLNRTAHTPKDMPSIHHDHNIFPVHPTLLLTPSHPKTSTHETQGTDITYFMNNYSWVAITRRKIIRN